MQVVSQPLPRYTLAYGAEKINRACICLNHLHITFLSQTGHFKNLIGYVPRQLFDSHISSSPMQLLIYTFVHLFYKLETVVVKISYLQDLYNSNPTVAVIARHATPNNILSKQNMSISVVIIKRISATRSVF